MKHQSHQSAIDMINKCASDEPVFCFRAQDALSPAVIRYWANLLSTHAEGDFRDKQLNKAEEGFVVAEAFENWQSHSGQAKLPD